MAVSKKKVRDRKATSRKVKIRRKPPEAGPDGYVSVGAFATYFDVSQMTVYRRIESGELPSIRLGKLIRIPHKAIGEWERVNRVGGPALEKKGATADQK